MLKSWNFQFEGFGMSLSFLPKSPPRSVHESLHLWNELSRFAIQTRHKLPYYMIATAHKFEQVFRRYQSYKV